MFKPLNLGCWTIALLAAGATFASAADSEPGGQGEIAFQGYYLGADSSPLTDITGVAATFRSFFPNLGLLSGSIETYGGQGQFRPGNNYVDLSGATWYGYRWRITGGDFRMPVALVPFPFTNIFLPELAAEGLKIEAASANRRYTFFYGVETLIAGPRVPFLIQAPQNMLGASVVQKVGEKFEFGVRALHLSTGSDALGLNAPSGNLFAPGQDFQSSSIFSASVLYKFSSQLQFYGEADASTTSGSVSFPNARRSPFSFTVGPVWKTRKLTVKANYIRESASYLPVAGYFLGDRAGPYVEAQYKPIDAIELFGSVSQYRNNIDNSADLATYRSFASSAGASFALPYRFSLSGQLSTIDYSVDQPGVGLSNSHNQQIIGTLGRPVRNHNLLFSYRDLDITTDGKYQRQQSVELGDVVQFKRFSLGAAVRDEKLVSDQSKNTIFVRGSAQTQYKRVSAYAYIEHGNDLANQTVFLTNTFNTTVIGGAIRITKQWNLQAEASRSLLNINLNPENIFLLQNQGAFVTNQVAGLNQWTAFFRVSRSLRWGHGLPAGDIDRYTAAQLPIIGSIEGKVREHRLEGNEPAKNVPVVLDDGTIVTTNDDGLFRFSRVSEGRHTVALAVNQLPADYDPGAKPEAAIEVKARQVATVELSVTPLVSFTGRILGPDGTALDGVIVKLLTTNRYTTPTPEGRFGFYNLREGEYDVAIDPKSLPEFGLLDRIAAHVSISRGTPAEELTFHLSIQKPEKPIRRVFEKKQE
ncbi:MAG TPA: hypothetical protein VK776_05365 [Bryobacteraceae bacterium]|nr:hypothetical protein [Bryobacteraceae bacterium]